MKQLLARPNRDVRGFSATFLVLVMLNVWLTAGAAPADSHRAAAAVLGWLKADPQPLHTPLGSTVRRVETYQDTNGAAAYHVVYLNPSGFVIVAADDRIDPIIAFAPAGVFDPSESNPLGVLVRRDSAGRMAWVRKGAPGRAAPAATAKWQQFESAATNLLVPLTVTSVSDVRIAPLTVSTWDQGTAMGYGLAACYNYYTPPYAAGTVSNYVTGCVATAMAQLMYYYRYPVNGVGTATFTFYTNNVATTGSLRGGNGSGGPYAWASMPANPSSTPPLAQCQAIGALMADAGFSVNMSYANSGSAASLYTAKNSLTSTFQFSHAVYGENQNLDTNFIAMLNANLDAHAPVVLAITDSANDGHAVVADGYGYSGATLYHHLNLGWSGTSTAWYALPVISTVAYDFTIVDGYLYNAFTNGSGEVISGRVLDQNSAPLMGATVTATRTGGGVYTALTDSNGIYALARVPSGSQYSLTATKTNYSSGTLACGTGTSADFTNSGNVWGVNFALSSQPTAVDHLGFGTIGGQAVNLPFAITVSALNRTNGMATGFTGPVSFSAAGVTAVSNVVVGSLGAQQSPSYSYPFTFGYNFTPNATLQVVAVRSYFGSKVSLWTHTGALLASQSVPNQSGAWVETTLAAPVSLTAGATYTVGVYCPAGTNAIFTYYANEWPTNFPNGTVGQTCYYYGAGDGFPTTTYVSGYGPFLDLRYTAQQQAPVAVNPANSGNFTNGLWSGSIAVQQLATNVVLTASDGQGHNGSSAAFNVGTSAPILLSAPQRSASQYQFTLTGGPKFQILASTNLLTWMALTTLTNSTGTTNYMDTMTNGPRRFYRAVLVP